MKTIFNLFLIFALAGFATRAQAQNTGDIRNSYNNDLPWTSEPNGVTPGPPAPPIAVIGVVDARDAQNIGIANAPDTQSCSDSGGQSMEIMPEFHNLDGFCRGDAAQVPASECIPVSKSAQPPAGGFHGGAPAGDGESHGGAPANGGRR